MGVFLMLSKKLLIWVFLIFLLGNVICCSLESHSKNKSNQIISSNEKSEIFSPQCEERLKEKIELFAVGEGNEEVLQNLRQCSQEKLINSLTNLQKATPVNNSIQVKIAFLFCRLNFNCEKNKLIILSALTKKPTFENFFADDAIVMISFLIKNGDKELLEPVFDSFDWADGALAEVISDIILDELINDTNTFLRYVKNEPLKKQNKIQIAICRNLTKANQKQLTNKLSLISKESHNYLIAKKMNSSIKTCQISN